MGTTFTHSYTLKRRQQTIASYAATNRREHNFRKDRKLAPSTITCLPTITETAITELEPEFSELQNTSNSSNANTAVFCGSLGGDESSKNIWISEKIEPIYASATLSLVFEKDECYTGSSNGSTLVSDKVFREKNLPASCSPHPQMWHTHEGQGESYPETRRASHDIASNFETQALSSKSDLAWDIAQDNDILRGHYRNRRNLVIDSTSPNLSPHIVITPVEEVWADQLVGWQNRVEPQWTGNLMVPPSPISPWLSQSAFSLDPMDPHSLQAPVATPTQPKASFSHSKFLQTVVSASIERLVMTQLVGTLQKRRCKLAFFETSVVAISFRERYDASLECFNSIERAFVWSDPAEPILTASTKHLGTTIIDSPYPFLVPHIIINAPPPQDFWISWNNATNNPQDEGYGRYLIIPLPSVDIVNAAEDQPSTYSLYCDLTEDQLEIPSRPETPLPETPIDEHDDLDFFLTRHGNDEDDIVGCEYYQPCFDTSPVSEQHSSSCEITHMPLAPRPPFIIEEDEDDLPPFDDWYK